MCLPAVALGATVVGGLLQAQGQLTAGARNQEIANDNARLLELSATDVDNRARADGEILRQQVGQRIGQQRAGLSASNVDVSRGSASNLTVDTAGVGELELMRTLNNAAREAYGMRTQATNLRADGRRARTAGRGGAFSTLLTTATSTFGQRRALQSVE